MAVNSVNVIRLLLVTFKTMKIRECSVDNEELLMSDDLERIWMKNINSINIVKIKTFTSCLKIGKLWLLKTLVWNWLVCWLLNLKVMKAARRKIVEAILLNSVD